MYREFYDVVCATSNDQFDRDLFVRVLAASGLSHDVLAQVRFVFFVIIYSFTGKSKSKLEGGGSRSWLVVNHMA